MRSFKLLSIVLIIITGFTFTKTPVLPEATQQASTLQGAWRLVSTDASSGKEPLTAVKIYSDNFFMVSYYDLSGKNFISSTGGTYSFKDGKYTETIEFNTAESLEVGNTINFSAAMKKQDLKLTDSRTKKEEVWMRIEEPANSPLAGAWRITGREQNGQISPMQQGPRKTIKILSGSRFQWAAFNTETKQFSGTGGGTYTAKDGNYTESIEFFSRDGNRVGSSLTFKYEVKGNDWHHSGLSSTGNKIYEVWSKQ
ncbi:membrane or secreted protein [Rhodocytophaga rosea]|uniref:Membrane or secreted protein n=1 Tax=Rhodocytophaga rosea TaxID=2704465 RepID=A0A6C0GET9_9BACT|nr:membrane or secreted protein [Rhodocytophaga rosea]QHT66495.1 membrane or secreted protein [Rhodocytophaga rosea]